MRDTLGSDKGSSALATAESFFFLGVYAECFGSFDALHGTFGVGASGILGVHGLDRLLDEDPENYDPP